MLPIYAFIHLYLALKARFRLGPNESSLNVCECSERFTHRHGEQMYRLEGYCGLFLVLIRQLGNIMRIQLRAKRPYFQINFGYTTRIYHIQH